MSQVVEKAEHVVEAVLHAVPSSLCSAVSFSVPTLDKPFGFSLWDTLRYATYRALDYDIESFQYKYNSNVPLSSVPSVVIAILAYYVIIFSGRSILRQVRPIKFAFLFKLHNLFLTCLSGCLLLLLFEQMFPIIVRHGVFYSICSPKSWTQKVEFIYYLNYLTKYYELLDTIFMVFRKRPLTFLHTYHHGATALLCFSQLNGTTSVSYVPISLNLAVHVLMYFYYFLSSCGIRPWWKAWVTRFQIIQFIIDLGFVYFATYTHFVNFLELDLPNMGRCSGEEAAAVDGCLILSSYLVLFVSFYIKSYVAPNAAKKAAEAEKKQQVAAEPAEAAAPAAPAPAAKTRATRASAKTTSTRTPPTTRQRATRSRKA